MDLSQFAQRIDHTCLRPGASPADIERLCAEAVEFGFYGVCVNPWHVSLAAGRLTGKTPIVISVAGFPLGATFAEAKAREASLAVEAGAWEIDMVLNVAALKAKDHEAVFNDVSAVVEAVSPYLVKVIIETGLLDEEEKRLACGLAASAGAAFLKTCTGFGPGAAAEQDVRLMREAAGPGVGIKASAGIRTAAQAMSLLNAGADRLGTSASVAIVRELLAAT